MNFLRKQSAHNEVFSVLIWLRNSITEVKSCYLLISCFTKNDIFKSLLQICAQMLISATPVLLECFHKP